MLVLISFAIGPTISLAAIERERTATLWSLIASRSVWVVLLFIQEVLGSPILSLSVCQPSSLLGLFRKAC